MSAFWSRWLYLILGGALAAPYVLLVAVGLPLAAPDLTNRTVLFTILSFVLIVTALVATSFVPAVRSLEAAVAPSLLQGRARHLEIGPVQTAADRIRNTGWYVLHTVVGAITSLMSLTLPPVAVGLLLGTALGDPRIPTGPDGAIPVAREWAVPLAIGMVVVLAVVVAGAGASAAWTAPLLLGPDPRRRVLELEQRTSELTERTRLARELHDTIGHALTVTTLQASAARTVLATDAAFVARALSTIEETGRSATADLDHVLGLLREEPADRSPQPTLADLEALVDSHRDTGMAVNMTMDEQVATVPRAVSREVYRIVQEGLTNVRRHADGGVATVALAITADSLVVTVHNARRSARGEVPSRDGGGHGLIGMHERVEALGGIMSAGPDGNGWRLRAVIPIGVRHE